MRCGLKISSWRVTVLHHETCRVMPNSYPEWWNFQFTPNNHYGFFFLRTFPLTIAFKLLPALFYQYYAKIPTFSAKKCSIQLLPMTLTLERLAENDVKNWHQKDTLMSCTSWCKTTFPCTSQLHGNSWQVCKNRLWWLTHLPERAPMFLNRQILIAL